MIQLTPRILDSFGACTVRIFNEVVVVQAHKGSRTGGYAFPANITALYNYCQSKDIKIDDRRS